MNLIYELAYDIYALLTGGDKIRLLSAMFEFQSTFDISAAFSVPTFSGSSALHSGACNKNPGFTSAARIPWAARIFFQGALRLFISLHIITSSIIVINVHTPWARDLLIVFRIHVALCFDSLSGGSIDEILVLSPLLPGEHHDSTRR
jgi:hypothetical protein